MKLAFVFPGQGSQVVGMGRELAAQDPAAARLFGEADALLGCPLTRLMVEGPEEELRRTTNTQPALLAVSTALADWLARAGVHPDYVAGHSLGEYSALVAAGALSFRDALQLVRQRAQAMEAAVPPGGGGMAAVLGLATEQVEDAVAASAGVVEVANYNCPGQVVLSGETGALRAAGEACLARGAVKVVPLSVAGPFHSSLMQPAAAALSEALAGVEVADARVPVVANFTADVEFKAADIRENLVRQLTGSVHWEESIRRLLDLGVEAFIEVGPGKVLSGLIRRIDRKAAVVAASDPAECQKVLDFLGEGG